jgi:hypothetical protein
MAMSLRVPYDVKDQRVRYSTLTGEPFVPPYGDIHHRTETLRGFSDGNLMLRWAPPAAGASSWHFGIGTTLPLGATVSDPVALGREGKKHQHLQFGSGVFSPEAEIGWNRPIGKALASALVQVTVPISANGDGFRAPKNFRWSVGPSFNMARTGVAVNLAGQYQTIGRWHGETDEGTGFSNGGMRVQLSLPPLRGVSISPSIYRELYSHGFNDETFSQGTTLSLTLGRTF